MILVMFPGSPTASATGHLPRWLVGAIRLLLLAEGIGWWAILIVITLRYSSVLFYYGGIFWIPILLGPAVLAGIPALVLAFRQGAWGRSWRTPVFLLLNTLAAILGGALAFSHRDPLWYYALIAAVTVAATLLLFVVAARVPATIAAWATAAAVVLVAYGGSYSLPPTVSPAPALHFKGVLIIPTSAEVTPAPAGAYHIGEVEEHGTFWMAVVVDPGTYRYAQWCDGGLNPPTAATVEVPWGAVVRARDQCPPVGTVSGLASWTPCQPAPGLACASEPYAGRRIGFRSAASGGVYEVTTDVYGHYSILLPPGSYTIRDDLGYLLVDAERVVTVEDGGTTHLDLAFRYG